MKSHNALGLEKDLVNHGVAVITVHFLDAVLVELGQRQQHLQGQSLGPLTVAQLHRLGSRNSESPVHPNPHHTCFSFTRQHFSRNMLIS